MNTHTLWNITQPYKMKSLIAWWGAISDNMNGRKAGITSSQSTAPFSLAERYGVMGLMKFSLSGSKSLVVIGGGGGLFLNPR